MPMADIGRPFLSKPRGGRAVDPTHVRRHSEIDTQIRFPMDGSDSMPDGPWITLFDEWTRARPEGGLPWYSDFEILNIPGEDWPHVCVTSLEGSPRRFFVRMIGTAIEANNGFYGNGRFTSEIPIKNRRVMAREFAWTVRLGCPVYTERPYIGATDYVKRVRRMITPYLLSEREYAFVFYASFDAFEGMEHRMRHALAPSNRDSDGGSVGVDQ